jgi:hypothetical protein
VPAEARRRRINRFRRLISFATGKNRAQVISDAQIDANGSDMLQFASRALNGSVE